MTETIEKKRDRVEIINELRRHAHPSHFQLLIEWPTDYLEVLLRRYESAR